MSTAQPLVSLIVPVYRVAAYLEQGVSALLAQTLTDWELILIDDGSPDECPALCDAWAAADARVRVIHQPNSGAGAARNAGIEAARGDYLLFPDADDLCDLTFAQTMWEAAQSSGADIVVCGYQSFDETGDRERVSLPAGVYADKAATQAFFTSYFPLGIAGYAWNKMFARHLFADGEVRFPPMRRYEDGVFTRRAFARAERVCVLPDVLYRYRINTLQTLFQKYPPNNFELLHALTDDYEQWLDAQGLRTASAEAILYSFFLNEAVGTVDCVYSPGWQMNHATRLDYLRRVAQDDTLRRAAAAAPEGLSRYAALVVRLLVAGRWTSLLCAMRVKLFLKRDCNRLFHKLKGALDK